MFKESKVISGRPRYLVCINEKSHAKTALFYACTKAMYSCSEVDMLYIIDPVDYNTIFSVADVIKEERRNDANKLFEELQEQSKDWSSVAPSGIIREGAIADEIIKQINDDQDTVMLIVGVAEDGSSNNKLLNKLTGEMGSDLQVPLMIVPGNLTKKQILSLNKPCML